MSEIKFFSVQIRKKSVHVFFISFFFSQQPPNINTELVSGAPVKGDPDFTVQAAQVPHNPKAPQKVAPNKIHRINQPR